MDSRISKAAQLALITVAVICATSCTVAGAADWTTRGGRAESGGVECKLERGRTWGKTYVPSSVRCVSQATLETRPENHDRICPSGKSELVLHVRGPAKLIEACEPLSYPFQRPPSVGPSGTRGLGPLVCSVRVGIWWVQPKEPEEEEREEEYVVCRSRSSGHEFTVGPSRFGYH